MPRPPSTRTTVVSSTAPNPTVSRSQGRSGRLASSASEPRGDAAALVQNDDVGREAQHVLEVMGDQDDRRRHGPAHLVELVVQAAPHLPVDGGEGLVQQQHARLARQGTGHRDALPFTPGQHRQVAIRAVGQVHQREQVGGARLPLAPRAMAQ